MQVESVGQDVEQGKGPIGVEPCYRACVSRLTDYTPPTSFSFASYCSYSSCMRHFAELCGSVSDWRACVSVCVLLLLIILVDPRKRHMDLFFFAVPNYLIPIPVLYSIVVQSTHRSVYDSSHGKACYGTHRGYFRTQQLVMTDDTAIRADSANSVISAISAISVNSAISTRTVEGGVFGPNTCK